MEFIAPVTEQLIRLAGDIENGIPVEHIKLDGLTFYHTSWSLPDEGYYERQAQVQLATAAIYAQGAVSCSLENIQLAHMGTHGIWFERGCQNNRIVRCQIYDIGAEREQPESNICNSERV